MSQEKKVFKTEWANRSLTIETGQLAKQANGAVLVRYYQWIADNFGGGVGSYER